MWIYKDYKLYLECIRVTKKCFIFMCLESEKQ